MAKGLPNRIKLPNGSVYVLSLMKIESTNVLGQPKDLSLIADAQTITLKGGERFMTTYVPENMLSPKI